MGRVLKIDSGQHRVDCRYFYTVVGLTRLGVAIDYLKVSTVYNILDIVIFGNFETMGNQLI